jgi:putative MFS transporter
MGASAGGLLPIAFTLMAETVPTKHRGWLLVALGGIGTSAGYLLAAGSAALLVPDFSWRSLWLLGLPTGLIIIFLGRYIPESPRFLANAGLHHEAQAVIRRFAGVEAAQAARLGGDATARNEPVAGGIAQLLSGRHAHITWALMVCGVAWGLVNFGFLLWLPTNLGSSGLDAVAASGLLARSALLALPGIGIAIWLYHRWSSIKALLLFIALTAATLLACFGFGLALRSNAAMVLSIAVLLASSSGVIAMLIPYATEIYPVHLRGTGSGVIAASSKFGGIVGAGLGTTGVFGHFDASAFLVAAAMAAAALLLARSGIETRGRDLETIHRGGGSEHRDPGACPPSQTSGARIE